MTTSSNAAIAQARPHHADLVELDAVDVHPKKLGGVGWSPTLEGERDIKHLQGVHGAEQQGDEDYRLKQRQRHTLQHLPRRRAVHEHGLQRRPWDGAQARQEDQRHEREIRSVGLMHWPEMNLEFVVLFMTTPTSASPTHKTRNLIWKGRVKTPCLGRRNRQHYRPSCGLLV